MPALTYDEILNQVRRLELIDQVRLLEELATIVHYRVKAWPKHSVLEFRGWAKKYGKALMWRNT